MRFHDRKRHWAVLPGQHTDTFYCSVCQACWVDVLFFRTLPVLTSPCTNRQCSPPAAQHLSNAMVSNEPSPFPIEKPSTTLAELGQALQEEWNRLPQMATGKIISSMPRRLNERVTNRGGIIHY